MAQPIFLTLQPQRRELADLTEAQSILPGLRIPRPIPEGAQLSYAVWMYPPKVSHQFSNGQVVSTVIDNDVPPSLQWGHVQLQFLTSNAYFVIDQGQFAAFGVSMSKQLGTPTPLQLANGRAAFSRTFSSADTRNEEMHVVGWTEGNRFHLTIWSTALPLATLKGIAETIG